MKSVGVGLWVVGVAVFLYAFFGFNVSISADASAGGIVNLDLQQHQLMIALAGLAMFVTGVSVHALAEVTDRLMPLMTLPPKTEAEDDANEEVSPEEIVEAEAIEREFVLRGGRLK